MQNYRVILKVLKFFYHKYYCIPILLLLLIIYNNLIFLSLYKVFIKIWDSIGLATK